VIDLDPWREIASTMRRNLLRTVLTAVGVFWGVLMLIVMVGFGNGLESGVQKDMAGVATNSFYVWGMRTSLPWDGLAPGKWVELEVTDADVCAAAIPEIEVIAPRVFVGGRGGGIVVRRREKNGPFSISGDVPAYQRLASLTMVRGRFLNELDMARERKVAVIGQNVVAGLFDPKEDPVGQTIEVRGVELLVVGVFTSPATGDRADRIANTIHVPLTTLRKTLRPSPTVNSLAVLVREGEDAELAMQALTAKLRTLHRVAPNDKQAIGSWNAEEEYRKIRGLFLGVRGLVGFVGLVTLLAGIVGVSNIMMISVKERTREIGVRRAIGAKPLAIVSQIVKEAMALTFVAGTLGLVLGVLLLEGAARLMVGVEGLDRFGEPRAELSVAIVSTIVLVLGGAIAGLIPALTALSVRPVVALRDE
jgi:putative ABC transport system permease protein